MLRLLISIIILASFSYAENVEIQVSRKNIGKDKYWEIKGNTELEKDSIVGVRLWFGDVELANSRVRLRTQEKFFVFLYKIPAERILDGLYSFEISFNKNVQIKSLKEMKNISDFQERITFYWGNRRQERRLRQEYTQMFQDVIEDVRGLHKAVAEQGPTYQQQKDNNETKKWVEKIFSRFREIQNKYIKYKFPRVLAPYSLVSINNLGKIMQLSEQALGATINPLLHSKDFDAAILDGYNKKIDELALNIFTLEPVPQNLNAQDLYNDLQWFNQLFTSIVENHREGLQRFVKSEWDQFFSDTNEDLKDFSEYVKAYQKSKLIKQHTNLIKDFQRVIFLLGEIAKIHTMELYDKNRYVVSKEKKTQSELNETQKELMQTFANLNKIVLNENEKKQQENTKFAEIVQQSLELTKKIESELSSKLEFLQNREKSGGKPSPQELDDWQAVWQQHQQSLAKSIGQIEKSTHKHSSEYVRGLRYLEFCLAQINIVCVNRLNQKQENSDLLRASQYNKIFYTNHTRLETRIKKFVN